MNRDALGEQDESCDADEWRRENFFCCQANPPKNSN